ncbi:acyl-CoA thioesterase [Rhodoferax sp. 4810]|uniref:Acyl-CoA thioesterase n=1 Tax=Thiospirillum jenense TaxID=1653858 RepID=A0A839HEQ8_9GAMM|nr:thioesterase family protein [Thiospirillum jenense]MBB1072964.1 acyl-CoA thioesterase [Rhodoferax jenense]MBB1124912.1 acyl-CoA thioesterase [Thiospirillum jenense]
MVLLNANYRLTVTLHDIDAAGVMFFAQVFRYAHDVYEQWMTQQGFSLAQIVREQQFALPLVHASADYHAPLRHGDVVDVILSIAELKNSSFTLQYQFVPVAGQSVNSINQVNPPAVTVTTVHVCIHQQSGKKRALPNELVNVFNGGR